MSITSFDRLLRGSHLALPLMREESISADRSIRMMRADRDRLEGKIKGGRAKAGGGAAKPPRLSRMMDKRIALTRAGAGIGPHGARAPMRFDTRQCAVVKVHYFGHADGGDIALKKHVRYIARDAAARDNLSALAQDRDEEAKVLEGDAAPRKGEKARCGLYDAQGEGVDGIARVDGWAGSDRRHFRVVLSPDNAARIHDLPAYTREVMVRAEAALGMKLQWVAADHHDTDDTHTHLIIRGRRADGRDLFIPKDFIKHGFRGIARDVATEWLGPRSPADERLALDRDIRRHAPTRLDRMIEAQLPENRTVRVARLSAPDGDPAMTQAVKARARELQRMGLATEVERNVLAFQPDWRARLKAMELHLDIRKRVVQERVQNAVRAMASPAPMAKGLPISPGRDL